MTSSALDFIGRWEHGKAFYPFFIDSIAHFEGAFVLSEHSDSTFIIYNYNWLENAVDFSVYSGTVRYDYSLIGSQLLSYGNDSIIIFSDSPRPIISRYSITDIDQPNDSVLYTFNYSPDISQIHNTIFFELQDTVIAFNKATYHFDTLNIPSSYKTLIFKSDHKVFALSTNDGIVVRQSRDTITKNQSVDLYQIDKVITTDSTATIIDFMETGTEIVYITADNIRSYTLPIQVDIFDIFEDKLSYISNDTLYIDGIIHLIPDDMYDPLKLQTLSIKGKYYKVIIYRNGILLYNDEGLLLYEHADFGLISPQNDDISVSQYKQNQIVVSTKGQTYFIEFGENGLYLWNRLVDRWLIVLTLIIIIFLAFIYYKKYQRAQREIKELTEDLEGGILFTTDRSGHIKRVNKNARELFGLQNLKNIDIRTFNNPEHEGIYEILNRANEEKRDFTQKINLVHRNKPMEYMFQINILFGTLGSFRGAVFFGTDITEELERKRLRNWAQLAHDMQTNLSVIKLNTEQLQLMAGGTELERLDKIKHQTEILLKRVRDIVTIGRGGSNIMSETRIKDFFLEIEKEISNLDYSNIDVKFQAQDFTVNIERKKLARAIRNAVENSAKAIQQTERKDGAIEVKAIKDTRYFYIMISDNGKGMDKTIRDRMLTPYFTTGAASGGSGIGTMIMSNVVELHGGKIQIQSAPGKGTVITFRIPLRNKNILVED